MPDDDASDQSSILSHNVSMFSESELFSLPLRSTKVGTPMYRPPEFVQLGKYKEYTSAADMWGLGCTLYKMLTAQDPFPPDLK